jgi:hypothetical protein
MANEIIVPGAVFKVAQPGPVTVLYDPTRPKRSLVYEYCGYKLETSAGRKLDGRSGILLGNVTSTRFPLGNSKACKCHKVRR